MDALRPGLFCDGDVADLREEHPPHMCYYAKFGRCCQTVLPVAHVRRLVG